MFKWNAYALRRIKTLALQGEASADLPHFEDVALREYMTSEQSGNHLDMKLRV